MIKNPTITVGDELERDYAASAEWLDGKDGEAEAARIGALYRQANELTCRIIPQTPGADIRPLGSRRIRGGARG